MLHFLWIPWISHCFLHSPWHRWCSTSMLVEGKRYFTYEAPKANIPNDVSLRGFANMTGLNQTPPDVPNLQGRYFRAGAGWSVINIWWIRANLGWVFLLHHGLCWPCSSIVLESSLQQVTTGLGMRWWMSVRKMIFRAKRTGQVWLTIKKDRSI